MEQKTREFERYWAHKDFKSTDASSYLTSALVALDGYQVSGTLWLWLKENGEVWMTYTNAAYYRNYKPYGEPVVVGKYRKVAGGPS